MKYRVTLDCPPEERIFRSQSTAYEWVCMHKDRPAEIREQDPVTGRWALYEILETPR